jgi:transketolase
VGTGAAFGLALGALDFYGSDAAPKVHVVEGEGGMTPGRVSEALAMASAGGLSNLVLHVDYNQASIDSDQVCREGDIPGDYVQWTPSELLYLHDWNVINVGDGMDFGQIFSAQELLSRVGNSQPTAIVYRTVKGWRYGIEGKRSHGAGHGFCSKGFYNSLKEFEEHFGVAFPRYSGESDPVSVEQAYWDHLTVVRRVMESHRDKVELLAGKLRNTGDGLAILDRRPREGAPDVSKLYDPLRLDPASPPPNLNMEPGTSTTLRGTLGKVLDKLNQASNGALLIASADLLESTGVIAGAGAFPSGYYNSASNPDSRLISMGGICEDGMGAVLSGVSSYGQHIGVGSSYAAFIAALQHVAARLHGIGNSARTELTGEPFRPFVMVCGHAGYKTGEDGSTHADPQALQLLQENFPPGICITLTPWDPQEIWPLMATALISQPAVIAIFVTRPSEKVIDRKALGLPAPSEAAKGVYAMRLADPLRQRHGTLVLQESGVTYAFVEDVLPRLDKAGMNLNVYYVASCELFDMLSPEEQEAVFPIAHRQEAMAITGFTQATTHRWINSGTGIDHSIHAFSCGQFPGSGQAHQVLEETGLDGESQYNSICQYVDFRIGYPLSSTLVAS